MAERNDGGAAFPCEIQDPVVNTPDGDVVAMGATMQYPGMTLRDYFAAAALQGIMFRSANQQITIGHMMAHEAYDMADAMLAARGGEGDE